MRSANRCKVNGRKPHDTAPVSVPTTTEPGFVALETTGAVSAVQAGWRRNSGYRWIEGVDNFLGHTSPDLSESAIRRNAGSTAHDARL